MNFTLIGRCIRDARTSRGLTQAVLAERADLSVSYISHVERGIKKVSLEALVRIAAGLDTTLDHLLSCCYPTAPSDCPPALQALMADCSPAEQQILCDVAAAVKQSLRKHHVD